MAQEMEQGGKLFFDLFVAMCNHMVSDDLLLINLCLPANTDLQDDLQTVRSPFSR
jgi:hypothetical protein